MAMGFRQAAKVLGEELRPLGYAYRVDPNHKHPRLYISCKNREQFTTLSATQNYEEGNILNMKRQDIRRDVLPLLPQPEPSIHVNQLEAAAVNNGINADDDATVGPSVLKSYPVKLFVPGSGALGLILPAELVPPGTRAEPFKVVQNGHLGVIFSSKGVAPGKPPGGADDKVAFYFPRETVPFKYAKRPSGKIPQLFAKLKGESLVLTSPLPEALLKDPEPKPKPNGSAGVTIEKTSVSYGAALVKRLNEWLDWARDNGLEPKVEITDVGYLTITVTETKRTTLS